MKKLLILLASALTLLSSSAQTDYPKLTLINQDTLAIFTIPQVKKINKTFLRVDELIEVNESLSSEINLMHSYLDNKNNQISTLKELSSTNDSLVSEYEIQKEILSNEVKSLNRKLKFTKLTRALGFGGGVAIGIYTYYLFGRYVTIQ